MEVNSDEPHSRDELPHAMHLLLLSLFVRRLQVLCWGLSSVLLRGETSLMLMCRVPAAEIRVSFDALVSLRWIGPPTPAWTSSLTLSERFWNEAKSWGTIL
jgi:hypothetical protein